MRISFYSGQVGYPEGVDVLFTPYKPGQRAKLVPSQAFVATAHKIARIVYHMLKEKTPYQAMEAAEYNAQMRIRAIKNLERKARRLGLQIVPTPT